MYGALHWAFPDKRVQEWVAQAAGEERVFEGVDEPTKDEMEGVVVVML